jgi:hypothetical protein
VRALALLEEVERSYIGLDRIAAAALGLREFADGRLAVACLPALAHALLPDAIVPLHGLRIRGRVASRRRNRHCWNSG